MRLFPSEFTSQVCFFFLLLFTVLPLLSTTLCWSFVSSRFGMIYLLLVQLELALFAFACTLEFFTHTRALSQHEFPPTSFLLPVKLFILPSELVLFTPFPHAYDCVGP
ncbi:hypothetical protein HOY80DRAFT_964064 [Tuber brumale]|nr:hypothetical protein HOY80DRAFT_964064 [Tuber brumale]